MNVAPSQRPARASPYAAAHRHAHRGTLPRIRDIVPLCPAPPFRPVPACMPGSRPGMTKARGGGGAPLLPLREKVDRPKADPDEGYCEERGVADKMLTALRFSVSRSVQHPSSAPSGHLLPQGEKDRCRAFAPSSSTGKRSGAERDPRIHAGTAGTRAGVQNRRPSPTVPHGRGVQAWILGSAPSLRSAPP